MKHSNSFLLVQLVWIFSLNISTDAFVKLIPVVSKVDLKHHKLTLNLTHCFNEPKSMLNQSLDFRFDILRPIKDVKLLFLLSSASRNGTIQNALIKRQIDLCFFLRNPRSDRLLRSIYDYARKHSHIPDRCPLPPGSYYMRNLRLADIPTPAFLPETEFVQELIFFSEVRAETLVELRIFGRLVRFIGA